MPKLKSHESLCQLVRNRFFQIVGLSNAEMVIRFIVANNLYYSILKTKTLKTVSMTGKVFAHLDSVLNEAIQIRTRD